MEKLLSRKHGFTLIELMIVMAIIAILAVLGIVAIQSARKTARDTQRRANAKSIQTALEAFFITNKQYPINADGVGGVWNEAGVQYINELLAIGLSNYISAISDPTDGDLKINDSSTNSIRYYYNRGVPGNCSGAPSEADDPTRYVLRVAMETKNEPDADCSVGEDFSMQ